MPAKPTEAVKPDEAAKSAATQPTVAKPGEVAKPAAAPTVARPGGVLRIAQSGDVAPREPHLRLDFNAPTGLSVWDTLTRYDSRLKPQPVLAERWEWSPDFKTLTIKLREGVKFHSGRELTSEDVEFNIVRIREPSVGSQMRGASNQVKAIERPDKHTIKLGFDSPYLAIFDMFESLVIVDRETIGQLAEGKVVGTGPFVWKEWTPNTKLVLEKNPGYWQSGMPLLERVEVTPIQDIQAMAVQLEAGQQDVAWGLSPQDFVRLGQDQKFRAVAMDTGNSYIYVASDVTREPLNRKEVRQALSYAIDRERFVRTVMNGITRPTNLPWPKGSPAYDEALDSSIGFDLDRARSLLQQAGLGSGFEVPITFNSARASLTGRLVELIQADLAKINVRLVPQGVENTVFQRTLNEAKFEGLFTHLHGFSNLTPVALFIQAFPFRKQNASNYTSPEYVRLIDTMQAETDEAKLKELYSAMNKFLLDEAFLMEVATNNNIAVARAAVQNLEYSLTDWWVLHRTTVS